MLTVSGEKRWQKVEGEAKGEYHLMERKYGRFARAFSLPHKVDSTAIEARCEQGILTVTLPKAEEAKPRRIQVQAGEPVREIEAK